MEGLRRPRIGLVGIVADQQPYAGWRFGDPLFGDEGGAGAGAGEILGVFRIVEKTDLFRTGTLQRSDAGDAARTVLGAQQAGPAERGERSERQRAAAAEKARVRHLPPDAAGRSRLTSA
jgi:hypothetical protein